MGEALDEGVVGVFELAAKGVAGNAADKAVGEGFGLFFEDVVLEALDAFDFESAGEFGGGVVAGRFDLASGIVGFEGDAPGVDLFVAAGAGWGVAVEGDLFFEGELRIVFLFEGRGSGGRRWWRVGKETFAEPDASVDGVGLGAVASHEEDATLGQDAAAAGGFVEFDGAEVGTVDAFDAIVFGKGGVEEGEVGLDKVKGAEVVGEDVFGESEGFFFEGFAGVVGKLGVNLGVNGDVFNRRQAEPLVGEVAGKAAELGVLAHAFDLCLENVGLEELFVGGKVEEFVVGHAGPKEVGESGGEFVGVEFAGFAVFLGRLDEVDELGGDEERGHGLAHGGAEVAGDFLELLVGVEGVFDFVALDFATVGTSEEGGEDGLGVVGCLDTFGLWGKEAFGGLAGIAFVEGAFQLDGVEVDEGFVDVGYWSELGVLFLGFGGVPGVGGEVGDVVAAAAVVVAAFLAEGEVFNVADELDDVLPFCRVDHLATDDFLGVVVAGSTVADMDGEFGDAAVCGGRAGDLGADGETAGEGALIKSGLAGKVGFEMGEFETGRRGKDLRIGLGKLGLGGWLFAFFPLLLFGGANFALAADFGGLEFRDGLFVDFFGFVGKGFVERLEGNFHVAFHEDGGHAEVLGVSHEAVFAGEVAGDVGSVVQPDAEEIF